MNKVFLTGRLTRDPELKYTPSQMAIVNVPMAVNRNSKGDVDFPRLTIFGKQAENVNMYCHKGSQVAIEGRIQTRSYKDKDGNDRFSVDVIAERVEFLGKNETSASPDSSDNPQVDFQQIDEEFPW